MFSQTSALEAQLFGFPLPFSSETNSHFQAVPQHCHLWLFTAKLTISKLPLYSILAVAKCFCGPKIQYANGGASLVNDAPQRGLGKVREYLCLWWRPQEWVEELKKKACSMFCFKTQTRHTAIATGNMKVKRKPSCCFQRIRFGEQRQAQTSWKWRFTVDEGRLRAMGRIWQKIKWLQGVTSDLWIQSKAGERRCVCQTGSRDENRKWEDWIWEIWSSFPLKKNTDEAGKMV